MYADINIPFVDAKVASALCKGGVVEYLVETSSGITDAWILQYVVPNMVRAGMQQQLCLNFGRAILWRVFDPSGDDLVPDDMRRRVMARYDDLGAHNLLPRGTNPVKKVPLMVDGFDTEVLIDRIVDDEDDGEGGGGGDGGTVVVGSDVRQRVGLRKQELRRLAMEGKYECF